VRLSRLAQQARFGRVMTTLALVLIGSISLLIWFLSTVLFASVPELHPRRLVYEIGDLPWPRSRGALDAAESWNLDRCFTLPAHRESSAACHWIPAPGIDPQLASGSVIRQAVIRFDNPVFAQFEVLTRNPGQVTAEDYGSNFNVVEEGRELHADRYVISCDRGDVDACTSWTYWSRYGQYVYEMRVLTDPCTEDRRATCVTWPERAFLTWVSDVDARITKELSTR
jgi:hypothetical protein